MRTNVLIRLSIFTGILALAGSASGASSVEDQIKRLAECYNQIEAQLNRSVHYLTKTNLDDVTTTEEAWINGAGDPIKVAIERVDSSGRELTEYFADDLTDPYEGMFLLTRKETLLPDGGTKVDESRKYFGSVNGSNGELVRELRKNARFKVGEVLDTVQTPNTIVNLAKQPSDNRSSEECAKADWELFSKPEKVVESLRKADPPESDPFAAVKGDSDKFRIIHGTASPDGRLAIALGFARDAINWDVYLDKDAGETGPRYDAESEEDIRNYVVDLTQQKILGETGCNYFGTRRRYNHRECIVKWSPDSMKFVQLWDDKWSSTACVAGKIDSGPRFGGGRRS